MPEEYVDIPVTRLAPVMLVGRVAKSQFGDRFTLYETQGAMRSGDRFVARPTKVPGAPFRYGIGVVGEADGDSYSYGRGTIAAIAVDDYIYCVEPD